MRSGIELSEENWLRRDIPLYMWEIWREKISDRQARLFAVACCRLVNDIVSEVGFDSAVNTAERFADGNADVNELESAGRDLERSLRELDAREQHNEDNGKKCDFNYFRPLSAAQSAVAASRWLVLDAPY